MLGLGFERVASSVFAFGALATAAPASGQVWIAFHNETSSRLADPEDTYVDNSNQNILFTDPDEKDFAAGDVDNDGDTDLVIVRKQPYTTAGKRKNFLFLNEEGILTNRTSAKAPQLLDLTNDRDAQLFDADGDGWLDLVTVVTFPAISGGVASDPPEIYMPRVYMNLGDDAGGNWLGLEYTYSDQRIPDYPANQFPMFSSVVYGDVDADGDADLFFVDSGADSSVVQGSQGPLFNRLLFNDGNGFFTDVTATNILAIPGGSNILGNGYGTRGNIADMNADGWLDLVAVDACSASPRAIRVAKNLGSANPPQPGVFASGVIVFNNSDNYDMDVGDIDGDGKLDIYEVDSGPDRILRNNGNNQFGNPTFMPIVFANQLPQATSSWGGNTYCVDLDDDAHLDQVVCDEDIDIASGGNRLSLLHNLSNGPNWLTPLGDPFTLDGELGTRDTFDAAILDINGDGLLDIVAGRKTGNKVFIHVSTLLGDIDGDGDLDLDDYGSFPACMTGPAGVLLPGCNAFDFDDEDDVDLADFARFQVGLMLP